MKTSKSDSKKSTNVVKSDPIEDVMKPSSMSSLVIPSISIAIALLAPIMTLGLISFDPSMLCNHFPNMCLGLNLATPSSMMIPHDNIKNTAFSPVVYLEFFNRMNIPVDTYWKDYSGDEQFWFTMEPFSYTGNISSIRGHVWSFRASESSDLLFEESIDLNHCGKIHIAPAEHIEALRQYCSSTGRAVMGHWPRAPVVRHIPRPSPIGTIREFHTENLPFESYETRTNEHSMQIETISNEPHMVRVENFLSDEECDYLIELSAARMVDSDNGEAASTWLEHGESPIVSSITRRVFDLMGFEPDVETFYFAEKMQVSRFTRGQEYLPHYDAMDLTTTQRSMPHNRYATVMMYLNSVEEQDGGADVWPRANKANEFLRSPCDAEFRLQPKRGTVVVLYSMFGDGIIDESSLHGSCPLKNEHNEKWTSNFFFWDPFVQWSPEQITI